MKRAITFFIVSLLCAASAMAADRLVVPDITVAQGKEAVLDIGCELQTSCKAFQMDVELGSGFTLKLDAAGKPVAELGTATDHKIYSRRVSNGKYRFVVISMNGKQLPKSGSLLKLTVVAPSTAQVGSSVTGSVKAIEFATAQTKPLVLSNATFKVTIATPPTKGDTNGDNVVDVADIATIIDVMAGSADVSSALADVNEDGNVDVADIATVIDIMAGGGQEPDPAPEPSYTSCPDDNHPHAIDLGLPSGTKWACCNMGATKPSESGGKYAWGETEGKTTYEWETYLYGNSETDVTDIGSDISNTQYDVAHVKWGGSWHMPTVEQLKELRSYCTREFSNQDGNDVWFFTSKNNEGVVIIPCTKKTTASSLGYYWSATANENYNAYFLYLTQFGASVRGDKGFRYQGQFVRPVR